jgi:3-deoxy-D-manno-octulosonic-acid transferase
MLERPARLLYTLLGSLALPWVLVRLAWRGRSEPGYRMCVGERFGRYRDRPRIPGAGRPIWIHAVSMGETRAIAPLVRRLAALDPAPPILLTHTTATGRAAGQALFGDRVVQAWLPYDLPGAMRRFLVHFEPRAGLLVETELWPNLAARAARLGVPLFLVNARMSARSAAGYARVALLARPLIRSLAGVAAQGDADAARLRELGAREVIVTGNLKFDAEVPAAMRERGRQLRTMIGARRPVIVAASTREGEEAAIADAWRARGTALPAQTVLVIVPRHPQRFDDVAALLAGRGIAFERRSAAAQVPEAVGVLLGDSLGELAAYYAAADVAFVGGSLLPLGGQNLIEPIALGVPTLIGPHTFNFADAANAAVACGAARRVADAAAMIGAAAQILATASLRDAMRDAGERFIAAHRGADARLWAWLAPRIGVD